MLKNSPLITTFKRLALFMGVGNGVPLKTQSLGILCSQGPFITACSFNYISSFLLLTEMKELKKFKKGIWNKGEEVQLVKLSKNILFISLIPILRPLRHILRNYQSTVSVCVRVCVPALVLLEPCRSTVSVSITSQANCFCSSATVLFLQSAKDGGKTKVRIR